VLGTSVVKLTREGWILWYRRDKRRSIEKRMARVMLDDLWRATLLRFTCGFVGGVVLPGWLLASGLTASQKPIAVAVLLFLLAGELAERYLFFRAAPASRMPGGLR
jgi:hypothetical protein